EVLCDIRSYPGSRKYPQFNSESLEASLADAGIEYVWLGRKLGGFRKGVEGADIHSAIKSAGFRSYVAHLLTDDGQAGIRELADIAARRTTVCMCAERLPFRCHRWFLSDFLLLAGFCVVHIIDANTAREHRLSPLIRLDGDSPIYDRTPQPKLDGLK
ncbi:MAG TPA: DUF488 domain-containing protein, partial [Proteobacteria bacterium]|nr:DUF488 domain-containing protein [Pseudomonadota bacterium]